MLLAITFIAKSQNLPESNENYKWKGYLIYTHAKPLASLINYLHCDFSYDKEKIVITPSKKEWILQADTISLDSIIYIEKAFNNVHIETKNGTLEYGVGLFASKKHKRVFSAIKSHTEIKNPLELKKRGAVRVRMCGLFPFLGYNDYKVSVEIINDTLYCTPYTNQFSIKGIHIPLKEVKRFKHKKNGFVMIIHNRNRYRIKSEELRRYKF